VSEKGKSGAAAAEDFDTSTLNSYLMQPLQSLLIKSWTKYEALALASLGRYTN
jgi:hypothetical protein